MADKILNENFDKEVEELNRVLSAFKKEPKPEENDTSIVERDKFKTEAGKHLYDLLVKISDDNAFLNNILYKVIGDEKKYQLIKYLEETKRTENSVMHVANLIDIGIWGLSGEKACKKFTSTEAGAKLFYCLRDIELILSNDDSSKIDYIYIFRIMSMLDTDKEREMLLNTIIRELEKREIPFNELMNLIYLKVQNFYDQKHDK